MMENAVDAAPVPLADLARDPLPGLVMGDAAVGRPRAHGWPGGLFYGLSYLFAFCLGALALVMGAGGLLNGLEWPLVPMAAGAALWSALQWRLAHEVEGFSRWGWYGAMGELGVAAAAKLWSIAQGQVFGAVLGLAVDVLWLRYFWNRRADFDIDLGA